MGSRDRRDPAGHKQRGKGAPTPPAPGNGRAPQPAHQAPHAQLLIPADNVASRVLPHPTLEGGILEMLFSFGNNLCRVQFPAAAWPMIAEAVGNTLAEAPEALAAAEQAARAAQSGIVLPGNIDIDATAEAAADAQRKLKGDPPA